MPVNPGLGRHWQVIVASSDHPSIHYQAVGSKAQNQKEKKKEKGEGDLAEYTKKVPSIQNEGEL